jgi:hypothetical protein
MLQKELLRKRARALFECCFHCAEEGSEDLFLQESTKYALLILRGPAWLIERYEPSGIEIQLNLVEEGFHNFYGDIPGPAGLLEIERNTINFHNHQITLREQSKR